MITVYGHEYADWSAHNLDQFDDQLGDLSEYKNQSEDYCDSLRGDVWAMPDDDVIVTGDNAGTYKVIFHSTFGNDHPPWVSHYTCAVLYDTKDDTDMEDYAKDITAINNDPEYI